jgi:predicted amidohydrolase YtcJ
VNPSPGAAPGRVLLVGGHIHTPASPTTPSAANTAMLIVDGTVAWIGDDAAAAAYADSADEVVRLSGRLVTAGFVDAHTHLASTGFALQSVDLSGAATLSEALDALSRSGRDTTGPVLFGHGWDETRWAEGRAPTTAQLDRAVGSKVAYVVRVDAHSAVVSTALIERCPEVVDLDGWRGDGVVERDAHHAVRRAVDDLRSRAERKAALQIALRHAASRGITCVHELNAPHIAPYDDFATIREIGAETAVPEVVAYWGELLSDDAGDRDGHALAGFAGDLCVDGAVGSRTAAMTEPYADADTRGHLYLDSDQVSRHVVACTRRNTQAGFHVIGDRATGVVVDGFRRAAEIVGTDALVAARHRLEHIEMADAAAIQTMARFGVVASVQPAFDAAWGAPSQLYDRRLGAARAEPMNPFGSMLRAGVSLAFGSDTPVTPLDPWAGVRAAAFHHEPSERISVAAAFDAHTRGGHRARRDDHGGVLAPGRPASYAVWDVGAQPDEPPNGHRGSAWLPTLHPGHPLPRCAATVVAGTTVYSEEDD